MTEQARDMMNEWMDESQQMWRSGMSAGTKLMEAATKVWSHVPTLPTTPEELKVRGERVAEHFTPFVRRNADVCVDTMQTQMKSGMDAFADLWKRDEKIERFELAEGARKAWNQGAEVTRRNWGAIADGGMKLADNWMQFCNETCMPAPAAKPAAQKPTK